VTGGKNGATPFENLRHLQSKPIIENPATLTLTKCPAHPTKRMWTDPIEAIREAEVRSTAAKMPIAAYRCDGCGNAHLCKLDNVRPGSLLTRPERNFEVFKPVRPGNSDAKRKLLLEYLDGRTEATSEVLMTLLDVTNTRTVGRYMQEIGWYNTRGRNAVWKLREEKPVEVEAPKRKLAAVEKPTDKPIDLAKRRHPSAQNTGWVGMTGLDKIRHIALGDLIDTLAAAGRELRIATREIDND
jgi:hypothetical protein